MICKITNSDILLESLSFKEKEDIISLLPDKRICDVVSVLIIRKDDQNFVIKVRPWYEGKVRTEEYVYIKKSEVVLSSIRELCDSILGKCVIFDASC